MNRILIILLISLPMFPAHGQNMILPLWEGDPPNYRETGEVTIWDTPDIVRIRNVQQPDIAVFLPSRKNSTGRAAGPSIHLARAGGRLDRLHLPVNF